MKTIVLLSGGIDSATALYLTRSENSEIYTMNVVYTQAHDSEAEAAKRLAGAANVKEHISIFLPFFKDIEKRYHPKPFKEISAAYLPARNTVFYGIAASYAETLGADRIVFGSNADDAMVLPDARPGFVKLMNELLKVGTRASLEGRTIQVVNPLIKMGKIDVLRLAVKLEVPLELTWSCYEDTLSPCGRCRGCQDRSKSFEALGMIDPLGSRKSA